jgi:hypothetical protein
MSGKPSESGVANFILELSRMSEAQSLIWTLSREIETRQTELKKQQELYRVANEQVFKMLEQMDVEASGNTGYEGRMSWFLGELYRQLIARK